MTSPAAASNRDAATAPPADAAAAAAGVDGELQVGLPHLSACTLRRGTRRRDARDRDSRRCVRRRRASAGVHRRGTAARTAPRHGTALQRRRPDPADACVHTRCCGCLPSHRSSVLRRLQRRMRDRATPCRRTALKRGTGPAPADAVDVELYQNSSS